jgi:peptidoglycan/xylan/chitin deacetylase (PgdA/CDA1 family)
MVWALLPLGLLLLPLLLLHAFWRIRYGDPPPSFPRVLAYHKITRVPELGGTWLSPRRLAAHLDALLARGYRFIDEDGFLDRLEGRCAPGAREILLTFDDGYRNFLEHALPLLEERGIPSLVFLPTDYAGRPNDWDRRGSGRFLHLSWDECRELMSRGVSFGSHGAAHADLTRLSPDQAAEDLRRSRDALEEALGNPPRSLSYPYGRTRPPLGRLARGLGFRAAFTLYPPGPNSRIDPFALPRAGVYVIDGASTVVRKLEPNALRWFEEMKGRCINGLAVLSPYLGGRGRGRRS